MFLAGLTDRQKTAFLNLAQKLVVADSILNEDELSMMEQYKQEMNLDVSLDECQEEAKQSMAVFQTASLQLKKKIVFELVGLACADRDYADSEAELVKEIGESFGLDTVFLEACKRHIEKLMGVYQEIGVLIGE